MNRGPQLELGRRKLNPALNQSRSTTTAVMNAAPPAASGQSPDVAIRAVPVIARITIPTIAWRTDSFRRGWSAMFDPSAPRATGLTAGLFTRQLRAARAGRYDRLAGRSAAAPPVAAKTAADRTPFLRATVDIPLICGITRSGVIASWSPSVHPLANACSQRAYSATAQRWRFLRPTRTTNAVGPCRPPVVSSFGCDPAGILTTVPQRVQECATSSPATRCRTSPLTL